MAKVGNNQPVMKEELIRQLVNMGWNQSKVIEALKAANYVRDQAIEILLTSSQQGTELVLSNQFDHLSLENIQRINEFPVGLKNVGNTCYVNSLFQIYFHISPLVEQVLTQNPLKVVQGMSKAKKECIELISQVYQLFSRMTLTSKKFLDPLNVLKHIVDESGNHIGIGQQQDAGEFNINFLTRLEEGYTNRKPVQQNILTKSLQISKGAHLPEDRGFIQSIFFGNLKEIIESKEQDGSQVCLMQEVDFGQIILDIQYKELYQAWYHFMHDQIDKFTTPLEFQTTAVQEA